jgi:hypothetical protein
MLRLFIVLVLLARPASAFAQEVFDPTESDLRIGQKVRVLIDRACETTPCPAELVRGKVAELTGSSLVIDDGRTRREFAATKIAFIERSRDRIWDGVLVGFGVGFAIGYLSVRADGPCGEFICPFNGPEFAAALGLLSGGIGAGIGAITDAAMSKHRVIFARTTTPPVPSLVASARGVSFTIRF